MRLYSQCEERDREVNGRLSQPVTPNQDAVRRIQEHQELFEEGVYVAWSMPTDLMMLLLDVAPELLPSAWASVNDKWRVPIGVELAREASAKPEEFSKRREELMVLLVRLRTLQLVR